MNQNNQYSESPFESFILEKKKKKNSLLFLFVFWNTVFFFVGEKKKLGVMISMIGLLSRFCIKLSKVLDPYVPQNISEEEKRTANR